MSIVFSAITPHPPILIPGVGKENRQLLKSTIDAYRLLEEELYVSQADSILIISPHGPILLNSFTMNVSPEYQSNFQEFGDFGTVLNFSGDIGLSYKIRERLETRAPLQLISERNLDHGSAIPLSIIASHMPKIKIIPIYYSGLNLESHYKFGQILKRELLVNKSRVAIIASGDLSHRLTKNAPAGFNPKGKKFDQKLIDCLIKNQHGDILKFNDKFISEAGECGLKSIVIMLGILNGIKLQPKLLSYEYPFGVGYLTMNMKV
jgi:aromatic ring-opening dioxygenase LigB subunit